MDTQVRYKPSDDGTGSASVHLSSPAKNRRTDQPVSTMNGEKMGVEVRGPGQGARRNSRIPVLFHRVTSSFYNPQFDSKQLEKLHSDKYFSKTKQRFQYALFYIMVACIVWIAFFAAMQRTHWISFVIALAIVLVSLAGLFGFSLSSVYPRFWLVTSVATAILPATVVLLSFVYVSPEWLLLHTAEPDVSFIGLFCSLMAVLLLIYTLLSLPLYMCVLLGAGFSGVFEAIWITQTVGELDTITLAARIILHVCIHITGIQNFLMTQARKRGTFLKVGQSIVSRRQLEEEKKNKMNMIQSLMPEKVANEVMKTRDKKDDEPDEEAKGRGSETGPAAPMNGGYKAERGQMKFRTFHMSQMNDVSIVFADIVGFTKMSSNKTAEHLVSLLNDLFGRFDVLCEQSGCEKISTLGDCYYCVSGCPEPKDDHAICCIEMGLGMCTAIQEFDEDHNEEVNMRVGVHTGTVLCGIVGTRRFKFDVWSHDVTLANQMESDGAPGQVHISESTYELIKDIYETKEGESVPDIRKHKVLIEDYNEETKQYQVRHVREEEMIKTYFITGYKGTHQQKQFHIPRLNKGGKEDGLAPLSASIDGKESSTQDANGMSLASAVREKSSTDVENEDPSARDETTTESLLDKFKHQKHDDVELIEVMTDERTSGTLTHLPINKWTLRFRDSDYESRFQHHYLDDRRGSGSQRGASGGGSDEDEQRTCASPRVGAFFDLLVSLVFLILISVSCFLLFPITIPWIVFCVVAVIVEGVTFIPKVMETVLSHPCIRHAYCGFLASLPVCAVAANFSCNTFWTEQTSDLLYCTVALVSLLHFINFTILSSWVKSILATVAGGVLLLVILLGICAAPQHDRSVQVEEVNATTQSVLMASTTEEGNVTLVYKPLFAGSHSLQFELVASAVLLVLLIWALNRDTEISYRMSFHGDAEAQLARIKMEGEKQQADWLLHNIIPMHVAQEVKNTKRYCANHKDVGVIFAKIVNYDDFYDESFEGGKEYLRVLNELFADFEELFDEKRYKDVEKIKTIGSCLMAASGLNPATRCENKDPNAHLYALADFSVDVLRKIEDFNAEIFNFDFEMAIGLNYGDVTAGVIGTTKLLYDIWGDTVNVSSRMYSTGKSGCIQVTELTANKLEEKFEFEYRAEVFVKGKGNMNTYLLVKKRDGAIWE